MLVNRGEIVHVIIRRLFDGDVRRHFVGKVKEMDGLVARLRGYAFVYDEAENTFVKRTGERERVVGLADSGFIINVLPDGIDIEQLRYETNAEGLRVFTDGRGFSLDASEFGSRL